MVKNNTKDNLPNGWFMLSNMLPPVGFFLYFKYRGQSPNKARKALIGAVTGIPIGLLMGFILNTYILK